MLLTLVVILILIWSAVVWSLYSNFLVFYENFSETENYHKARYASIAATERAELVIRQRQPWYIWSGWRKVGVNSSEPWSPSDGIITSDNFSYLSNTDDTKNTSTLFRNINSRTNRVPLSWEWNVDRLLSTGDSQDYNMMDYDNSEIFLLYYDDSTNYPYSKTTQTTKSDISKINVYIRLPWFISSNFGPLNTNKSLTPAWNKNDPIVDRQLKWEYWIPPSPTYPFTIFATQRYETFADSAIREEDINNGAALEYSHKRWNPIRIPNASTDVLTIISPVDSEIKSFTSNLTGHFKPIFDNSNQLQLKLSLLNLVEGTNWSWMIYPFLEYYVDFGDDDVIISDKYYTIQTEWNFWDYQIDTVIFKPTVTESILKSFTTIL